MPPVADEAELFPVHAVERVAKFRQRNARVVREDGEHRAIEIIATMDEERGFLMPLILALETKNDRLFRLLMQHKADPNVVNDRKVSALMLAITNNEPEQVKSLLEAGAKVTQEAARAGTASGANAEIVKLMNSYLPGVRQSDVPEKKSKNKASGTADKAGSAKKTNP